MSTITPTTQLRLINNLANLGTASSTDLLLIQRNLKSFKFQYSDLVTGLPDDTTIEASSNKLRIKDLGVTTEKIANDAVNFSKMQGIANNTLIGNVSGSSGDPSEVDIITDLGSASNTNIPTGLAVQTAITNVSSTFPLAESNDGSFGGSPIGNGSLLSVAHNLSQTPKLAIVYFKCIEGGTNAFGYEVDDELIVASSQSDSGTGHSALLVNSTNIKYRVTWYSLSYARATGSNVSFKPANYPVNWEFRFRVFA